MNTSLYIFKYSALDNNNQINDFFIAENMDEDEVCSYIKKTFKELLLLWKNSENNMGR